MPKEHDVVIDHYMNQRRFVLEAIANVCLQSSTPNDRVGPLQKELDNIDAKIHELLTCLYTKER